MSAISTVKSNLIEQFESLAFMLIDTARSLREGNDASPADNAKLMESLTSTLEEMKQPHDDLSDMMMGFVKSAAIRLFISWKVFENVPIAETISYKELAGKVGSDESLISKDLAISP